MSNIDVEIVKRSLIVYLWSVAHNGNESWLTEASEKRKLETFEARFRNLLRVKST